MSRQAAPGVAPRRTADGFESDGAQPHNPSAPRRLDGLHVQVGGERLITCVAGSEDDRLWFEKNPARSHRIRPPIGAERSIKRKYPRGVTVLVAVRQVRLGARVRLSFDWRGPKPLNSEEFGRDAFEAAAAPETWIAEIERRILEHVP